MTERRHRREGSRAAAWFLAVFGAVFLLGSVVGYADATALHRRGVDADATVVATRPRYVAVEFETRDGRRVTAEVEHPGGSPRPETGDTMRVRYDPEHPDGVVVEAGAGPDYLKVWLTGALGLLGAILAGLTFAGRIDWSRRSRA